MLTQKIQELAQLKASVAKLEAAVAAQLPSALAALPEAYGYPTMAAFIKALKQAGSGRRGRKVKLARVAKPRKRKRAKVTDEIKAAVKALFEAGNRAGAIAKETGVSVASVNVLKKALGLTKARKSAA
jgi:hypothetical protein